MNATLSLTAAGNIPLRIVQKSWGREEILLDEPYCVKRLIYTRKLASSLHFHERKHESFYVLKGLFLFTRQERPAQGGVVDHTCLLVPGDFIVIPPHLAHRLRLREPDAMSGAGVILECSTRDDPEDCIRLIPSEVPEGSY